MPLDSILDIESLLKPITEDKPQGDDIREDRSPSSHYYRIKDARNDGRSAERSAMFDEGADTITPWQTVIDEAQAILKEQSKDIEVACWMIEGLIRLHGFSGMHDGFKLLSEMIDQYWEDLYPEPDEDGIETKVLPITGLNGESGEGTLLAPMRNTQLAGDYDDQPFTYWEYLQARNADQVKDDDEKAARIDSLGYSIKGIESSIANGDGQFYTHLLETLEATQTCYKDLSATLRKYCGNDAPPSSNINKLLDEIIRTCQFIFSDKLIVEAPEPDPIDAPEQASANDITGQQAATPQVTSAMVVREGTIIDREDALKRLSDIAEYFRRYEPHTPIGPGIERIMKWGRMTVSELMMELLPDEQAKGIYSQLTGVALDGSDTKTYVAPPKPIAQAAAQPSNNASSSAGDSTPSNEAAPEEPKNLGW